jgi:SAM-dependent methyltransferase
MLHTAAMKVDSIHEVVEQHLAGKSYTTILDIGAWFIPYGRATHVVDLMPWETRGCKLTLDRLPGENFSKETWVTLDICDPNLKLPFPDKFFDFVICGGTVEDLPDPAPCIREMIRVGRAGYIRVPTMACELTIGVEDRANNVVGYVHHHWICRSENSSQLQMLAKADAGLGAGFRGHIPLVIFERNHRNQPLNSIHFFWEENFTTDFTSGPQAKDAAAEFLKSLNIPACEYMRDAALRFARRTRSRLRGKSAFGKSKESWWQEMLQISKPYSDPDLHRKAGGK